MDALLVTVQQTIQTDVSPAVVQKPTSATRGSSAHYPGKQLSLGGQKCTSMCQVDRGWKPQGPPGKGSLSQAVLIKPDNAMALAWLSQERGKNGNGRTGFPSSKINVHVNLGRRKPDSSGNLPI